MKKLFPLVSLFLLVLPACGGEDDSSNGEQASPATEKKDPKPDSVADADGPDSNSPDEAGATETNVAPAPCESDDDCPEGVTCRALTDGDLKVCDLADVEVQDDTSSGSEDGDLPISAPVPAPCTSDADCPDGIECIALDGGDFKVCNIDDTQVQPPSSAAPAPCMSDDECPEGIACMRADGEDFGFCAVDETIEPQ